MPKCYDYVTKFVRRQRTGPHSARGTNDRFNAKNALPKPSVYFEFDTRKSDSNKAKHGIDFVEAQALWKSKHVLLGAKDALEKRYMIIGRIGTQHWSAIITYRGGIIRIISVRKSTATEIETYEKIAR